MSFKSARLLSSNTFILFLSCIGFVLDFGRPVFFLLPSLGAITCTLQKSICELVFILVRSKSDARNSSDISSYTCFVVITDLFSL